MTFTYGSASISVNGAQLPFSRSELSQQNRIVAVNGYVYVYNRGWREDTINIRVIDSIANIESLRGWLQSYAQGSLQIFTYTPDPGVNAGNGAGMPVTVRLWGNAILPIDYISPNNSSITILLRKEVS